MNKPPTQLPLYLSMVDACSYLEGRESRNLFVDPEAPMTPALYSQLIQRGFRRSGRMVYRPYCEACRQCVSARLPVTRFDRRRRHRRNQQHNRDLRLVIRNAGFVEEHFKLYRRYLTARHADGAMADSGPEEYRDFLIADWCDTHFVEFRHDDRLLAVAVTDQVDDGLSAVYTFFDPDQPRRSLGTFAILSQLALCHRLGLPYLYLGYWVRDCAKMAYKADFRPLQLLIDGQWREFGVDEEIPAV